MASIKRRVQDSKDQLLRRLGQKIIKDLSSQNMTVDRLALQIGIARSTLREIAAGRSNPRILTVAEIAKGLGYSSLKEFLEQV